MPVSNPTSWRSSWAATLRLNGLEDLESHTEIARLTDQLPREADANGRLPTPVSDILAAAELREAPQTFLGANAIAGSTGALTPGAQSDLGESSRSFGPPYA
jgi:hypothetical protein